MAFLPSSRRIGYPRAALLVSPDRQMRHELGQLLSQEMASVPVFEMQSYPSRKALVESMSADAPDICLLDVTSDTEAAMTFITDLITVQPSTRVIALLGFNGPDLILRCLRQGAAEFLLHPFTSDHLNPVLERLSRLAGKSNQPTGKVYCVMPVKGACGASTIACNLAYQWKRQGLKKNLLADMDPLTGTLSFLLKIKWAYSFYDALTREGNLDLDIWKGLITHSQGLDVLLSPENPMDLVQELQNPEGLIEFCRLHYETVTIDTGSAYGEWALSLAKASDQVLLVTTNELPSLRATQRTLAYLDRERVDRSKLRLVINRYYRNVGLSQEAIETALHTDVFHIVPSDYDAIQKALMEGKPIPASTSFGKSLVALADRLAGRDFTSNGKKSAGLSGLFSSLLSRR